MKEKDYIDFENQGWEAMLQTLDREMPTEKKRRGFFWLFLSLGLVATGSGLWWLSHNQSPKISPTHNPIEETKQPNTSVKVQADALILDSSIFKITESRKKEQNTEGGISNANALKNTVSERTEPTDLPKIKTKTGLSVQIINEPTLKTTHYNPSNAHVNANAAISQTSAPATNYANLENTQTTTNNTPAQSFSTLKEVLNNLALRNCYPLSIETAKDSLSHIPITTKPASLIKNKPFKAQWGITAGIHSENLSQIDGFQVGWVYVKPLAKRWLVATGLQLRLTQTVGDSIKYYKTEAILDPNAFGSALQKTTSVSLDKLYYLELPLSIQYRFARHFSVSTGIKTAYLLDQTIKDSGNLVYWTNGSVKNNQVLMDMVNSQTLGLNRWDASWISGVSYAPNKHIALTLRYDLGLVNILKRNNWAAYNRYLGLNATYLF